MKAHKNSNHEKPLRSIGISLSILSATLFFFSFFVIIYVLVSQQAQNSHNQSRLYGETVVGNLIQVIELSDKNEDWLQAYVVAVGTNPGLIQITIVDKDGRITAHSDPKKRGQQFPDRGNNHKQLQHIHSFILNNPANAGSFMRFVAPVSLFSQIRGEEERVFADVALPGKIEAFTAGETIGFLLGLVTILAFNIGLLYIYLNKRVIAIVRRLTWRAGRIANGNFSERLVVDRNDELGQLATSFNIMAQTIGETTVSRDFFDQILHSMGDSLLVLDPDLTIITVNQATLALLGYDKKELIGKKFSDIIEQKQPQQIAHSDISKDKPFHEMFYISKDERRIPVLTSRALIENKSEHCATIVYIAKDISERIQAEQDIRLINANLTETNEQLQQTQEQLIQSAKLASLGEMAAGIAHELNQPLQVISMSAELGISYLKRKNYNKIETKLETIGQQLERATVIVNHLRTFGREASGDDQANHDINHIIEETFILFNEQFRVHGIEVRKQFEQQIPMITCNPIQLEQVLSNLLVNAKDALEESPKKIITMTSRVKDKVVIIEVQDTGGGMDQTVQKNIFDPFFTTKEVGKGTGLGLSISYQIIKDHGGSLEVESAPGKGTIFRIQLPVTEESK